MTPGPRRRGAGRRRTPRLLDNVVLHVDWNQASIDSNRVCRDGDQPGDYVQWNPIELAYLHDWNVDLRAGRHATSSRCSPRSGVALELRQRPAHRDRLPHGQGLAVRHRGARLARRRPQALLRRVLRRARRAARRDARRAAACEGSGHALQTAPTARRHGGVLLGGAARCPQGASRSDTAGRRGLAGAARRGARAARRRAAAQPRAGAPRRRAPSTSGASTRSRCPTSWRSKPGTETTLRGALGRRARAPQPGDRRRVLRRRGRSARLDQREQRGQGIPRGLLQRGDQPRLARLLVDRRHLRGRHGRRALPASPPSAATSASGSSYGAFIAPLGHIAARLHAHRQPGATGTARRARTSRSSSSAPTPDSRPARTDRPTPIRRRSSSCRRTSPAGTMITLTPVGSAGALAADGRGASRRGRR